ncbi:MAG: tetratricopeptide repeat protein [Candidatus Coatesbacteria bacterium]
MNAGRPLRLGLLALVVLLPLAYWPAWDDCYPLAKWLVLVVFGGAVVVMGLRPGGAFAWVPWWAAWVLASVAGPGVTGRSRAWPEAVLLCLPPAVGATAAAAGVSAPGLAVAIEAAGVATAGWALVQFAGLEPGGWLSPFHKGVASTVGNPDLLGGALLLPFALALAGWVREPARWTRLAVAAVIGGGLACTEARAAWLGGVVAAGAVLWRAPGRTRYTAGLAAVAILIAVLARPGAAGRLANAGAMRERVWTWALALDAAVDRPLAGWGASSFRTIYLAKQTAAHAAGEPFYHYTEYAHLEPLHLAVELGLIGLGLWVWGLAAGFRLWRRSPLRESAPAVWAGIGAGALAILVDAAFSWPWHVPPTIMPAWIMVGACAAAGPKPGMPSTPAASFGRSTARTPWIRGALAVAGIAALVAGMRLAYVSGSLRLGQALAAQGRLAEAGAVYARAGRLGADDVRLRWYAAAAAHGRGDLGEAGAQAARGLVLEPDFVELRLEAGAVARAAGDDAAAEAAWRAALLVDPLSARGWNNLGNLLGSQGRLREAEAAQRRAVELAPGMPEARRNLAITLLRLGRKTEARRVLEDAPAPGNPGP